MSTSVHFELYRDRKKEIRWRLVASNGKKLADSAESYRRRIDAVKAITLVRHAEDAEVVDLTEKPRARRPARVETGDAQQALNDRAETEQSP